MTLTYRFCARSGCGHDAAVHVNGTGRCSGWHGSHNDPEGGEWPCRCPAFVEETP